MHLSTLPYMRWAKTESGRGEIPLTMSAVPPLDWDQLGFDPASLELFRWFPYGDPELLEAIAAPWGLSADNVLVASSTTHAHFCFAASSVSMGDRVLYECPGYLPLVDALSMLEVEVIRYGRRHDQGYRLPREQIEQLLDAVHPRLMLLTQLHNPSGARLSEQDCDYLVELCERRDLEIICDEIYRPALDPDPGPLCLRHPNIISVGGLNKIHGLPMIRIGWGLAHPKRVEVARRLLDSTTVHNSCLSEQVALFALQNSDPLRQRAIRIAREGWEAARPILEKTPLDIVWPSAGFIAFPRVAEEHFPHGDAFREKLLEYGVGVTPGKFFEAEHHFRFGVGADPEVVAEGARRIAQLFDDLG